MDSDNGSNYEPDEGIPHHAPSHSRADSFDATGASTPQLYGGGGGSTAVGTPMGSETGGDETAEATPAPEPEKPAKKSKALNFLKKKEPKTSINIKGTTYKIRDDEIVLGDDPRGEAKIDSEGNLLGGRKWKVHTFTSPLRSNPNKVYLLSIDAARCAGFRDSLYFFRRNPLIHKLSCNQAEKDRLIELGRLSGNLKSRAVTMVSARNVFKVMGATFVADGKYVFDDYYEDKALAAGHKPGEPAFVEPYDPEKDTGTLATSKGNAPVGATSLGLNVLIGHPGKPKIPGSELITSQIGGGINATFGGTGLQPFGKSWDPVARKAKPAAHLTHENWMLEYAEQVKKTNDELMVVRKGNVGQVQVGLNVEEKEEDCWEWVEEEYEEEEEEPPKPMQVEPPAAASPYHPSQHPHPLSHQHSFGNSPSAASPSPYPPPPAPYNSSQHPSAFPPNPHLPHLPPHPSSSVAPAAHYSPAPLPPHLASPTPAPPPPPAPPAPAPRLKKKRLIRIYNPIRGVYEAETNVPHVYQSTQPTFAVVERVDRRPQLYNEEDELVGPGISNGFHHGNGDAEEGGGGEEAKQTKRRKLEDAAGRVGAASLEFVSDERAWGLEDEEAGVVAALRAKRGREPLVSGQWDFLALAAEEGAVVV